MRKLILPIVTIGTLISFSAQALDPNSYLREQARNGNPNAMREMDIIQQQEDFRLQQQQERERQAQEMYQQQMLREQQLQTQALQRNYYR